MAYFTCKHIKTDGLTCQSPAMRDRDLCFYHQRALDRLAVAGCSVSMRHVTIANPNGDTVVEAYPSPAHNAFDFGLLDDAAAVQIGLSTVLYAISYNKVDLARADRLLYALKLASVNLRYLSADSPDPEALRAGYELQVAALSAKPAAAPSAPPDASREAEPVSDVPEPYSPELFEWARQEYARADLRQLQRAQELACK